MNINDCFLDYEDVVLDGVQFKHPAAMYESGGFPLVFSIDEDGEKMARVEISLVVYDPEEPGGLLDEDIEMRDRMSVDEAKRIPMNVSDAMATKLVIRAASKETLHLALTLGTFRTEATVEAETLKEFLEVI